jgi:hypothetical protein
MGDLEKNPELSKKEAIFMTMFIIVLLSAFALGAVVSRNEGQTYVWDMISDTEKNLRDLYSKTTQMRLKSLLPTRLMNFTDCLIWESELINYTEQGPEYENVIQVLNNGTGGLREFVWVFAGFCIANDIPVRVVTVGYIQSDVVDHMWAQVNPSGDGEAWIQVEVNGTCGLLQNGETINDLWNVSINNNSYYINRNYKMVLAYEMKQNSEITITDVTSTFSGS